MAYIHKVCSLYLTLLYPLTYAFILIGNHVSKITAQCYNGVHRQIYFTYLLIIITEEAHVSQVIYNYHIRYNYIILG